MSPLANNINKKTNLLGGIVWRQKSVLYVAKNILKLQNTSTGTANFYVVDVKSVKK